MPDPLSYVCRLYNLEKFLQIVDQCKASLAYMNEIHLLRGQFLRYKEYDIVLCCIASDQLLLECFILVHVTRVVLALLIENTSEYNY